MLEFGLLALLVVGACCLFGALIGGFFKLVLGTIGVVTGGLFGLLFGGLFGLLVVPIVLFVLLPLMAPVLFVVGLVWLIVHASRSTPPAPTAH